MTKEQINQRVDAVLKVAKDSEFKGNINVDTFEVDDSSNDAVNVQAIDDI